MNRLLIDVNSLSQVMDYYDVIKVYRAVGEEGSYAEITDVDTRIVLEPEKEQYYYEDVTGGSTHWYKTAYYNPTTLDESDFSDPRQGGTEEEKIGYTFDNYTPPPGEWGKVYTADDMRYTMLFGIDTIAANTARDEWTDEQFDQHVREALAEFEKKLHIDIRKRVYKTNPADALTRSRLWRDGVDYTDEEDEYAYDYLQWSNMGFLQLRHNPIISVERAIWKNLVNGEIMDLIDNDWLRVNKKMGQVNFYPKGGFPYGPFSVYGPIWTSAAGGRYPQGFEIDYTTGFKSSDFVDDGLRGIIAKYAAIKSLATIGDGLLAGFSSQSISLDGLSESFSSTQSATSAYFGARIKQYSDEIKEWLKDSRYLYAPIPISFVGA